MTDKTIMIEHTGHMVRVGHVVVIILVTAPAIGGSAGENAVQMTFLTNDISVSADEGECGIIMIEGGGSPALSSMALCAVMVNLGGIVVRILSAHIVGLMAGPTIGGSSGVYSVNMAFFAGNGSVLTGKRERSNIMVEGGRFPAIHGVTLSAIMVKLTGGVIGIGSAVIIVLVTAPALCGGSGENSVQMTLLTFGGLMGALQRVIGVIMIKG